MTPPKELQKGGIENAVEGLREALHAEGATVIDGANPEDESAIHHFHGLWNPKHSRTASQLRERGLSYVVSPHGMLEPWAFRNRRWKKLPYFHLIEKGMLRDASAVLVTSAMERDNVARLIRHPRVEVIPLGCRDATQPDYETARHSLGWNSSEKIMLYLSRVDPKKGLDLLIDAMAQVRLQATGWKLVIVGDGPPAYRQMLEERIKQLGESLPPIVWAGPLWGAARWPYLQGADLFCLPTHSENFGIAVLEALGVGTPVLTTTQTPWVDLQSMDGVFIADPETTSIRQALEHAEQRISSGWSQQDRELLASWASANFSWPSLAPKYLDFYQSVASHRLTASESPMHRKIASES